ncbi:serine/threonine-protein kinase [Kribbella jejuensis]|uniref:serine/threonine-protein kinase n=1 Tax=Kribbella jejuensis TaxID=236068 RepID=UPI001EE39DD8|nr:serine/threonine-protein kinase [Kribbella jejuensis]
MAANSGYRARMLIAQRYRLDASLGRGGMGQVHRASDEVLGRPVAVKMLLRPNDAAAAERFQREACAAARLSDPHIVAVYDFGQHEDNSYLVMELVQGRSVAAELAMNGRLSWERAVAIVEQAAAGLAAAHAQDVVHRDIKPSNLLIAADGTIKVADFGIAQLLSAEPSRLTATGQLLGSPHYLSPERARGLPGGPEADVYALGCVLYELVTGHPPFTGDHPAAILYQHVDKQPIPPGKLRPELASPFEGVLLKMLAKAPEDRPTAAELTALSEWRDRPRPAPLLPAAPPVSAAPPVPAAPPVSAAPPVPAAPPVSAALPVSAARTPLLVAVLALLAVGSAVAAGVVLRNVDGDLPTTGDVGPRPSTNVHPQRTAATVGPTPTHQTGDVTRTTTGRTSSSTTRTVSPGTPAATPSASTPQTPPATTSTPTAAATGPTLSNTPSTPPPSSTSAAPSTTAPSTTAPSATSTSPSLADSPSPSSTPPASSTPTP